MNDEIRNEIKRTMKERGISAYKVAKDVGIAPSNLSRMLAGRSGSKLETWQEILEYLGLKVIAVKKE